MFPFQEILKDTVFIFLFPDTLLFSKIELKCICWSPQLMGTTLKKKKGNKQRENEKGDKEEENDFD